MNAKFTEIHAAADYLGPGAVEVPMYQSEITDLVRRRGIFGQRIKLVRHAVPSHVTRARAAVFCSGVAPPWSRAWQARRIRGESGPGT